jgi:hypothetical protein
MFLGLHIIESCGIIVFLTLVMRYSGEFRFLVFYLLVIGLRFHRGVNQIVLTRYMCFVWNRSF